MARTLWQLAEYVGMRNQLLVWILIPLGQKVISVCQLNTPQTSEKLLTSFWRCVYIGYQYFVKLERLNELA